MTRRILLALALVVGTWGFSPAVPVATACPMCKAGLDGDDARPRAYFVSILFMLTVPLCLFSGLGYGLWRLSRQETERLQAAGQDI
tara:strand:+ start:772 stop:1029 length:258 start_codon:yes stop_codon:yes gene_type:complete